MLRRNFCVTLFALLGLAAAPAAANAAALYATPSPTVGASCSAESPCGLSTALSTAVSGDTVVIGAGTYGAGEYSDGGKSLTIEGAVIGVGRPVVDGSFELTGSATQISDVELYSGESPAALTLANGAAADRVLVISTRVDGCQIESTGGSISNSVCASKTTFFSGLSTQGSSGSRPMSLHNVTMVGHNGFYSNSSVDISITDSIAMRNSSSGEDASLGSDTTKLVRSYTLHSSGTALTDEEPLEQEPIFLGPNEYGEAPGSPSIDAGSESAAPGELDLDGNLRKIGAKTDIGAYEFVPEAPSVSSPSTTSTTTSATVEATINPNSGRTYYHLEYGPTSAYGSSTPIVTLPAATAGSPVQFALSNLTEKSTIHYSIVATSDGGTTKTPDATFTTTTPVPLPTETPHSTPPPSSTPPTKLVPKLSFNGGKGGRPVGQPLLDRSAIKLSTACGPVACNVTVAGLVKVGSKSFGTLPGPATPSHWQAGKQGAIKLRISSKLQSSVRAYLEANPGARAKVFVTATFVTTEGDTATRKLTIPVRPL